MSDSTASVAVSTLVADVAPYAIALITAVVVPWCAAEFRKLTGAQVSQDAVNKLNTLAKAEAGALIAASETNLAGVAIPLGSTIVADAAERVIAAAPGVLEKAGLSPSAVATMVAGHIGEMQALAPAPAAPLSR
jgi:hypothetical protein